MNEEENIFIIAKEKGFIVVKKPPGIPVQPDKTGAVDLLTKLKEKGMKCWPVHRLDRPVGGTMLIATNEKTAAILSAEIAKGNFEKYYLAVVQGETLEKETLRNHLLKNERLNLSKVVTKGTPKAKEAILHYEQLETIKTEEGVLSLLLIKLETGRHHQIRVQLANRGLPIWGDVKYHKKATRKIGFVPIGLWSYSIGFYHPTTNENKCYQSIPTEQYPFSLFSLDAIMKRRLKKLALPKE